MSYGDYSKGLYFQKFSYGMMNVPAPFYPGYAHSMASSASQENSISHILSPQIPQLPLVTAITSTNTFHAVPSEDILDEAEVKNFIEVHGECCYGEIQVDKGNLEKYRKKFYKRQIRSLRVGFILEHVDLLVRMKNSGCTSSKICQFINSKKLFNERFDGTYLNTVLKKITSLKSEKSHKNVDIADTAIVGPIVNKILNKQPLNKQVEYNCFFKMVCKEYKSSHPYNYTLLNSKDVKLTQLKKYIRKDVQSLYQKYLNSTQSFNDFVQNIDLQTLDNMFNAIEKSATE